MELTYYGRTCVRIRSREATIAYDPYTSIVGPTGRGITADIVTLSYGLCEADLGTSATNFYNGLWQQAAAQGMSVFVSSGDSGAASASFWARGGCPSMVSMYCTFSAMARALS